MSTESVVVPRKFWKATRCQFDKTFFIAVNDVAAKKLERLSVTFSFRELIPIRLFVVNLLTFL
jgi:hypothetical protein